MKNLKILVNRERLSKDYVQSKANFGHVLSQVKNLKPPVWKTPWFYGPIAIAVVLISLSVIAFQPVENEKMATLHESNISERSINNNKPIIAIASSFELDTPPNEEIISPKKAGKINETEHEEIFIYEEVFDDPDNLPSSEFISPKNIATVKDINTLSPYPNIEGVFTSEIPIDKLCSSTGIVTSKAKVISFSIQYFNGSKDVIEKVRGSSLSKAICNFIRKYNLKSMIFITSIVGLTEKGSHISIPSLNYIPI